MLGDIFRVGHDSETISAEIAAVDEHKLEHKLGRIGAGGKKQPSRKLRGRGRQDAAAASCVIRPERDVERNAGPSFVGGRIGPDLEVAFARAVEWSARRQPCAI